MLKTPVLFLVFNRPDTTERVFEQIRIAKPTKLFIAADGPRDDKEGEIERCSKVREIVKKVDWDCEIKTLFREKNLGCKMAVSSAISWFFENVEEGIILEDDCLPNQSFFSFCSSLLVHYRDNSHIMHISGTNFQNGKIRGQGTYYFSKYPLVWGWASWRRAWKLYDLEMNNLELFLKSNSIENISHDKDEQAFWLNYFAIVHSGKINTWDIQWLFSILFRNGLSIIPNKNLISNIGFGIEATHTIGESKFSNLPIKKLDKIVHPAFIKREFEADYYYYKHCCNRQEPFLSKGINQIKRVIRGFL